MHHSSQTIHTQQYRGRNVVHPYILPKNLRSASEMKTMKGAWSRLEQGEDDSPTEFFGMASVIQTKMQTYDVPLDDVEANHNIVGN